MINDLTNWYGFRVRFYLQCNFSGGRLKESKVGNIIGIKLMIEDVNR